MSAMRKITLQLPADLLERAQALTGKGITETVRLGLERLTVAQAYEGLRKLRGKVHLKVDLDELREDRR